MPQLRPEASQPEPRRSRRHSRSPSSRRRCSSARRRDRSAGRTSVTTKGCSRARAPGSPGALRARGPPSTIAAARAARGGRWLTSRSMNTTPSSANIEPTDRSMPPVMITKPFADAEDAEQADQVGHVEQVHARKEQRIEQRRDAADHDQQRRQAEFLLAPSRRRLRFERLADRQAQHVVFAELRRARACRRSRLRASPRCGPRRRSPPPCRWRSSAIATPAIGEAAHQRVDLALGADVDAARGLVEDHHARLHRQPLGEHHLLLVAARTASPPA